MTYRNGNRTEFPIMESIIERRCRVLQWSQYPPRTIIVEMTEDEAADLFDEIDSLRMLVIDPGHMRPGLSEPDKAKAVHGQRVLGCIVAVEGQPDRTVTVKL